MSWVDRYQREMRRSRWVGITGAMLVLIAVVRELCAALYVISITESFGTDEVAQALVPPLLVGIAFVARAVALRSAERPYYQLTASWFVCACVAASYIWWTLAPPSVCKEGGVCFNFYDISRPNWVETALTWFLVISFVRSTITGLYAAFKREYK